MKNEATIIRRCPLCGNRLYSKKCGLVCKNHQCSFYWKLGGWCLRNLGSSVWQYTDNCLDAQIRWDKAHGYPPRKEKIHERHLAAMFLALQKDENLCFIIPLRFCLPDKSWRGLKLNDDVERLIQPEGGYCELCESYKEIAFKAEKEGSIVFLCEKHGNAIDKQLCGYGGVFQ